MLSPTLENYLEAIYHIVSMHKVARSMEIAEKMNVKRSSVTIALRSLSDKGLINYQARSFVTLTDKGLRAARCVDRRHHILLSFFTKILGLSHVEADSAACSMEHGMSSEVCRRLTALLMAMKNDSESAEKLKSALEKSAAAIDCSADCGYTAETGQEIGDTEKKKRVLNLNMLKPGDKGVIAQIQGSGALKKRLLEMGIVRDQDIAIIRAAPLDDPIEVKVQRAYLSLRREEAAMILVNIE